MAKNFKIKIKNTQLAKAAGLDKLKEKLAGKEKKETEEKKTAKPVKAPTPETEAEEQKTRRIRAKAKSSFVKEEEAEQQEEQQNLAFAAVEPEPELIPPEAPIEIQEIEEPELTSQEISTSEEIEELAESEGEKVGQEEGKVLPKPLEKITEKLGPTGRHINDILPPKKEKKVEEKKEQPKKEPSKESVKAKETTVGAEASKELKKGKKVREFKDVKPLRRDKQRSFDARDRKGLSEGEDERWRKKRAFKGGGSLKEEQIIRPNQLKIRLPITLKDLASEMKLKAAEIIQKLFLTGMTYTLNDLLDDETTVQYIGSEFGCAIIIDTSEEERIQITSQTVKEEIAATDADKLVIRPPVVAFMGHVDHGKTSLIDAIRKSNITAGEAGAITQHIGAFKCKTAVGDLTILDTPGHEAFSAMRARGAEVTDIVVLVVAGDEGLREQTVEAIQHAKAAGVTIVVAINKCDKPNFNAENVYRELAEIELLPEAWGGQTITVNTSAVTGEGITPLLEMLALQAEVMELKADPHMRARGTVLESELHKGLGSVATILVQNGTLQLGDAIAFEQHWGRVKTMHDEHGKLLNKATPSTPIEITGLSGLPKAGDPFIVVKSEKEAKNIIETREVGRKHVALQQRKSPSLDKFLHAGSLGKKVLKLILRADVQGSVEALKTSILKIESEKVEPDVIFTGVGEISESDIQLAAASNAVIIGFHTAIESHAETLIKELQVSVRLFDIIYHAIEEVKALMLGMLDKIEEEKETGTAEVKATFKASHLGVIAGCLVTDGVIHRNHKIRVIRGGEVVWKGQIASIKRVKEDVREIKKGFECGILLDGFNDLQAGDILQAYEIIYTSQEL